MTSSSYFLYGLLSNAIDLYVLVLSLRIWMQITRVDFYNCAAQLVVKLTQPLVAPLRRIIPAIGPVDSASLLLAFFFCMIKFPILVFTASHELLFSAIFIKLGFILLIKTAGVLVFWVIIIRSILSWVNPQGSSVYFALIQLTEPMMNTVRRILPPMGGIDFAPMLIIFLLYGLNHLALQLFGQQWLSI
jgi:YggT family protein